MFCTEIITFFRNLIFFCDMWNYIFLHRFYTEFPQLILKKHNINVLYKMVKYTCEKCNKIYTRKTDYTRHINRKNPCDEKVGDIKNNKYDNLIKKIEELEKSNNILTDRIKKLEIPKNIMKNSNNNNNITNNNTINLTITPVDFGKQDDSFIDEETSRHILKKGYESVQEYTKIVHFNNEKPQYQNVYVNSWKNKKDAYIFINQQWQIEKLENVINDLKNNGIDFVKSKYAELDKDEDKNSQIVKRMEKFIGQYDDSGVIEDLDDDLKRLLYNKKDMVKREKISNIKN